MNIQTYKKLSIVLMLFFVCFLFLTIKVFALDGASTTSNFFNDKILPYIAAGGTGVAGTGIGTLAVWRKMSTFTTDTTTAVTKTMGTINSEMETTTKKITDTEIIVKEKLTEITKKSDEFQAKTTEEILAMKKNSEEQIAKLTEQNKILSSKLVSMTDDVKTTKETQMNTYKMIQMGFCNDAELVKNGVAAKIMKIGQVSEETKKETNG